MKEFHEKYKAFVLKHYWIIMYALTLILLAGVFLFGMEVGHSFGHFCF